MMMRPALRHGFAALACAALLAAAADAALAAAPGSRNPRKLPRHAGVKATTTQAMAQAPAAEAPAQSGMMAFLDPETGLLSGPIGQFVPPADQRAAAANVLLRSVPLPRGGWIMDLKGTGQEFYVLQIDPLGTRRVACIQDPRALSPPLPVPTVTHGEER